MRNRPFRPRGKLIGEQKQRNRRESGGYWRPDDTLVWASYFRGRYIYTADHVRGIDVLRLKSGAHSAQREVRAKPMSARQQRFLARLASTYRADPATRGLCLLIQ